MPFAVPANIQWLVNLLLLYLTLPVDELPVADVLR